MMRKNTKFTLCLLMSLDAFLSACSPNENSQNTNNSPTLKSEEALIEYAKEVETQVTAELKTLETAIKTETAETETQLQAFTEKLSNEIETELTEQAEAIDRLAEKALVDEAKMQEQAREQQLNEAAKASNN